MQSKIYVLVMLFVIIALDSIFICNCFEYAASSFQVYMYAFYSECAANNPYLVVTILNMLPAISKFVAPQIICCLMHSLF
jgi:hypothetical protein